MKLERLLTIVIMLLSRKYCTAKELAQEFNVSVRTIYRDIETINSAGIPVESFQGVGGGYGIPSNYKISRQLLTYDDMVTLLSALKGLNSSVGQKTLSTIIEKITSLIPDEKYFEYQKEKEQLIFDMLPWGGKEYQEKALPTVQEAIKKSQLINFNYQNNKGIESSRTVEPMTLIWKLHSWYLFGYCLERDDYRLFRLSRIRDITIKKETFVKRDGTYDNQLDHPLAPLIPLKMRFDRRAKVMVEDSFIKKQITHHQDGTLTVSIEIPNTDWIYSMLLSYGDMVTVLEPQSVREKMVEYCTKITALYQT